MVSDQLQLQFASKSAALRNAAPVDEGRELAEQLKRMEIIALKSEPVTPFETASAEKQKQKHKQKQARSESGSRKASAAASTDGSAGLEESKLLKQELKARGLSSKGSKAELKARLAESKSAVL